MLLDLVLLEYFSWCLNLGEGCCWIWAIWYTILVPKPNGGVLGDVAGFGPVGTRLLVAKLEGGHS